MGYEIPFSSDVTRRVRIYSREWMSLLRSANRKDQRSEALGGHPRFKASAKADREERKELGKALKRLVKREHAMGDWLQEQDTAACHVGYVLGAIRNPHRFPSQQCTEGHHLLPTFDADEPCPAETTPKRGEDPKPCKGTVKPPRTSTGCRAITHYFGLMPGQDGRLIELKKGEQASFDPEARRAILQPGGVAEQMLRQHSPYREIYDEEKERLIDDRDLPDWRADKIARIIMSKEWLRDLLMEWKDRVPLAEAAA